MTTEQNPAGADRVPGPDHAAPRRCRMAVIPPAVRSWLYGIATAAAVLLGAYGYVADEMLPLWIGLITAVLGTGTATAYRPTKQIGAIGAHE